MAKPYHRVINASELSAYGYCSRAWWLEKVVGEVGNAELKQQRTSAGIQGHEQHGREVRTYQREGQLARWLWLLAAALLVAWLVITIV